MEVAERLRELRKQVRRGFCSRCGKQREATQRHVWHCQACAARISGAKHAKFGNVEANPYAGIRPCRQCGNQFMTADRRSITCCAKCREWQFMRAELVACEEAIYVD